MLISLKVAMLQKGIRQTRMAVELGWDPAKLSRIVNEVVAPGAEERKAVATYLNVGEDELFRAAKPVPAEHWPANSQPQGNSKRLERPAQTGAAGLER